MPHPPELAMMTDPLTLEELGAIAATCAGSNHPLTGPEMTSSTAFDALEVDRSLRLAVIAEIERRFGMPLGQYAEHCLTPQELVAFANSQITSGA
jgi:minimal PKS acyl carrier protein